MAQINEVDIPRWARYWVKPLTPSRAVLSILGYLRYLDSNY